MKRAKVERNAHEILVGKTDGWTLFGITNPSCEFSIKLKHKQKKLMMLTELIWLWIGSKKGFLRT
jgi:hypothetical protein